MPFLIFITIYFSLPKPFSIVCLFATNHQNYHASRQTRQTSVNAVPYSKEDLEMVAGGLVPIPKKLRKEEEPWNIMKLRHKERLDVVDIEGTAATAGPAPGAQTHGAPGKSFFTFFFRLLLKKKNSSAHYF